MSDWFTAFMSAVIGVCLVVIGWGCAHGTVAQECEKLGAFYVNDKVFECRRKM